MWWRVRHPGEKPAPGGGVADRHVFWPLPCSLYFHIQRQPQRRRQVCVCLPYFNLMITPSESSSKNLNAFSSSQKGPEIYKRGGRRAEESHWAGEQGKMFWVVLPLVALITFFLPAVSHASSSAKHSEEQGCEIRGSLVASNGLLYEE